MSLAHFYQIRFESIKNVLECLVTTYTQMQYNVVAGLVAYLEHFNYYYFKSRRTKPPELMRVREEDRSLVYARARDVLVLYTHTHITHVTLLVEWHSHLQIPTKHASAQRVHKHDRQLILVVQCAVECYLCPNSLK